MTTFSKLNAAAGRALIAGSFVLTFSTTADEMSFDDPASTTYEPVDSGGVQAESIGRSTNVESKLTSEFADFLGGEARAAEVVSGLRTGELFEITEIQDEKLVTTPTSQMGEQPPSSSTETGFTIDPPTDSMGYGNVRLTMRLTQANLETLGITHPTNEQLSAMLVGGEIDGVQFEGILNERAAGAGWGEIAQRYDFKVGQLMGNAPSKGKTTQGNGYISSGASKSRDIASGGHRTANSTRADGKRANGYIPSGKPARGASATYGAKSNALAKSHLPKKNGYIASGKRHATGSSITSANGTSSSQITKSGNGRVKGLSKGYVPSGSSAEAGLVSAGNLSAATTVGAANGRGHAKQHGKNK